LFTREVRRIYPNALGLAVTSSSDGTSNKFDARIGLGSPAAQHIATVAEQVADAFIENVYLKLRKPNPFTVGPILQNASDVVAFKNAVHKGYSGLNNDELPFALALDRTGLTWCRNPSRSGYSIPLVAPGKTENFYPDFLVWSGKNVFAIDTKGAFLHSDAMRKLVRIRASEGTAQKLFVRFVTPGLVDESGAKKDSTGFTVWSFKPNGKRDFTHYDSVDAALKRCLKPDV
jgi:type III restriction enzyme